MPPLVGIALVTLFSHFQMFCPTLPLAVVKDPGKSNLPEEGFTVAHSSILFTMMGMSRQQELEAAVSRKRAPTCAQLAFCFLSRSFYTAWRMVLPPSRVGLPNSIKLSKHSPPGTSRG